MAWTPSFDGVSGGVLSYRNLSKEIDQLRDKANALYAFTYERRTSEEWSKFWGCLDTLRDMDEAISELLFLTRKPSRAEFIGFLQILVSQQDAIKYLFECVGCQWEADKNSQLPTIRDLRNRISGHSAWSGRGKKVTSTSMINSGDIRKGGFKAVIYYGTNDQIRAPYVDIDFTEFAENNMIELKSHVPEMLAKMNEIEDDWKETARLLDWSFLSKQGDGYLIEKLWFPWSNNNNRLDQAKTHAKIFKNRFKKAQKFFVQNKIHEISEYDFRALTVSLDKMLEYLNNDTLSENEQLHYYVLFTGWVELHKGFYQNIYKLKEAVGFSFETQS